MVVFGMCFTMIFSKDFVTGLIGFLASPNKNGYWYLMTLAVFYVSLLLYRLNIKQKWYVDAALAIFLWGGVLRTMEIYGTDERLFLSVKLW